MEKEIACCGNLCSACSCREKERKGCNSSCGTPGRNTWADATPCAFYTCCVTGKNLQHCGECLELPCPLFYTLKAPNISEKEQFQNVEERMANLRRYIREKKSLQTGYAPDTRRRAWSLLKT